MSQHIRHRVPALFTEISHRMQGENIKQLHMFCRPAMWLYWMQAEESSFIFGCK